MLRVLASVVQVAAIAAGISVFAVMVQTGSAASAVPAPSVAYNLSTSDLSFAASTVLLVNKAATKTLHGLAIDNGKLVWSYAYGNGTLVDALTGTGACSDDLFVVLQVSDATEVASLDASTGRVLWRAPFVSGVVLPTIACNAATQQAVLFVNGSQADSSSASAEAVSSTVVLVTAYDGMTGEWIWNFAPGGAVRLNAVGNVVYLCWVDDPATTMTCIQFQGSTGAVQWAVTLPNGTDIAVGPNGDMYALQGDGALFRYDVTTGNPVANVSHPFVAAGPLSVGTRGVYAPVEVKSGAVSLLKLNVTTLAVVWSASIDPQSMRGWQQIHVQDTSEHVYFLSREPTGDNVYVMSGRTGELLWQEGMGGHSSEFSSLAPSGTALYGVYQFYQDAVGGPAEVCGVAALDFNTGAPLWVSEAVMGDPYTSCRAITPSPVRGTMAVAYPHYVIGFRAPA